MNVQRRALTGQEPVRAGNYCTCLEPAYRLSESERQAVACLYNRYVELWNAGGQSNRRSRPEDDFVPPDDDVVGVDNHLTVLGSHSDLSEWRFHCQPEDVRLCRASQAGGEWRPIPQAMRSEHLSFWRILALAPAGVAYELWAKPSWQPFGGLYFTARRNSIHFGSIVDGFSHQAGGC